MSANASEQLRLASHIIKIRAGCSEASGINGSVILCKGGKFFLKRRRYHKNGPGQYTSRGNVQ
jgi:hypothetical protein